MGISEWLTLIAILVALFGERIWRYFDANTKKIEVRLIIKQNLEQLKADLLRIRDERNAEKKKDTDNIIFNSTSFSEVNGYYFLFSDLLLPNIEQLELSKYPATIEFFNHYKINMETVRKREEDHAGTGVLTLATVNKLISRLENAIDEFKSRLEMPMCVIKVRKIVAREGLIIIILLCVAGLCFMFEGLQSSRFDAKGNAYLTDKDIKRYNLFIPTEKQKDSAFDNFTAMPVDSVLSRDDYIKLAKEELLSRCGFNRYEWDFFSLDELEKRFGAAKGEKVNRYYKERENARKEMQDWGETHLASMAGISYVCFYKNIGKISYLKTKINFYGIAIFFLIFIYPIYLLTRFIIWAIKTVREK